eukprot:s2166_g13.t1
MFSRLTTRILLWRKGGYTEAEIQEQLSNDLAELFPELFGPDRDADPPPEDAVATRKGESNSVRARRNELLLPFSVKEKLKPKPATPAPHPPYGYVWSGGCLIKKTNRSRPDAIDHSEWRGMNKQQRADAIEEHAKRLREENEVQYQEALKEVPAMPVLYHISEEHRDRIKTLYDNKLHQVVDEMYAVVAKVLSPKEIASSPEAQAAMDKEWKKLVDKGCWVEKKVREFEAVASEAKKSEQKDAHPFRHVFEPNDKHATPARKEDYWDIGQENQLAIRHHHYPRKRLYMPNEDDARIFPGIGPRRYTVVAKSSEHIVDDCNQVRDRCLQEWWDGETYFDLGGREQIDFERAVAATRKGKPVRNKSEAKKEVKQSKFVTPSQDQQEKPGAMTKPVTRVTYDMRDFLESCVERYCELAKVERKSLKPAATPFHELRVALPTVERYCELAKVERKSLKPAATPFHELRVALPTASEKETAGSLQPIASKAARLRLFLRLPLRLWWGPWA